ncbi:conjugal transfer protein TraC [Escherichia coli]|uniref:Conjugal transfer protein TraC n=1 Tax=Escherichia coli TaxID=562 RepID=A0A3L2NV65_ECOLX|nr:conjugal transfer protein TraC [Escherichia coli]EFN7271851.1 conjugal transfer protein TraC [Escherichia coli O21]EFI8917299.1 conjugal transfer protein TraC [Escherichia coli]EFJ4032749.1 conjugal transfer protein TraC [Escherichia coli]EFN8327629.1 conjugal transfer protein TraC [Escherichia coli]
MGHRSQQSPVTLKYRDSHNGSHPPLTFFRKSRFADEDVPTFSPAIAHIPA